MIYLDNAATTFPKPECVYQVVDEFARTGAVNAGRGSYRAARAATELIHRVKREIVSLADARDQADVALTPSVTVALNQVIGGFRWHEGSVAYVTPYEHNAVLRPLELVRRRRGVKVVELPLRPDLSLDLEATAELFAAQPPDFVCVSAVSNVTGYVQPAREVFTLAREHGAFCLLDAAQAMGLVKLRFAQVRADAIAFAGHKTLYAPFGVAGLLVKRGVQLDEFLAGGNGVHSLALDMPRELPEKLECASTDVVAVAGLAASLDWLKGAGAWKHERALMDYLLPRLEAIPQLTLYRAPMSAGPEAQAGVVSFNVEGLQCKETAGILDERFDIAVRAGHHCAAFVHKHLDDEHFGGTVRASVGAFTTTYELDALVEALRTMDKGMLCDVSADALRGTC